MAGDRDGPTEVLKSTVIVDLAKKVSSETNNTGGNNNNNNNNNNATGGRRRRAAANEVGSEHEGRQQER